MSGWSVPSTSSLSPSPDFSILALAQAFCSSGAGTEEGQEKQQEGLKSVRSSRPAGYLVFTVGGTGRAPKKSLGCKYGSEREKKNDEWWAQREDGDGQVFI